MLVAGLLLWLLRPLLAPEPAGGGLRLGSLYVLWNPGQEAGTVRNAANLWLARQPSGEFAVFVNEDPYGSPLLWTPDAVAFQSQLGHESYGLEGGCERGNCAGDLCRLRAQASAELLLIWGRRYAGGLCPNTG